MVSYKEKWCESNERRKHSASERNDQKKKDVSNNKAITDNDNCFTCK